MIVGINSESLKSFSKRDDRKSVLDLRVKAHSVENLNSYDRSMKMGKMKIPTSPP